MSFPNPDNYARDCDCGTAGANTTPPPATIQAQLDTLNDDVTVLESSVTALESSVTTLQSSVNIGSISVTDFSSSGSLAITTQLSAYKYLRVIAVGSGGGGGSGRKIRQLGTINLGDKVVGQEIMLMSTSQPVLLPV